MDRECGAIENENENEKGHKLQMECEEKKNDESNNKTKHSNHLIEDHFKPSDFNENQLKERNNHSHSHKQLETETNNNSHKFKKVHKEKEFRVHETLHTKSNHSFENTKRNSPNSNQTKRLNKKRLLIDSDEEELTNLKVNYKTTTPLDTHDRKKKHKKKRKLSPSNYNAEDDTHHPIHLRLSNKFKQTVPHSFHNEIQLQSHVMEETTITTMKPTHMKKKKSKSTPYVEELNDYSDSSIDELLMAVVFS